MQKDNRTRAGAERRRVLITRWDDPGATLLPPFRCRYFFSWSECGAGRIAGYFGGYLGGGDFHDDAFQATFKSGQLVRFIFSGREWISDRECTGSWPKELQRCANAHADVFWQWVDREEEERSGRLWMAPERARNAAGSGWRGWELEPDHLLFAPAGRRGHVDRCKAVLLARQAGIAISGLPVEPDQ